MGMRRLTCIALALGLLVGTPATSALAQRDVKAELAKTQAAQRETAAKAQKLASEVKNIKSKLIKASSQLRTAEDSLQESDRKLSNLQEKRKAVMQRLYRDENSLQSVLGAARRYDRTPTALLMIRRPPLDAARTSHLMKSLLPSLEEQSLDARSDLAELSELESALTDEKAKNQKELSNYNKEQEKLDVLLKDRQKIYSETEQSRKAQEREVARLAQEAKNLEDLVAKIRQKPKLQQDDDGDDVDTSIAPGAALTAGILPDKKSRYALPSHIPQPVSGTVRTGFGEKDDLGAVSKGVTFSTRGSSTVIAPLGGTVRFAGPFQKYRRILIIEHRGGYHTLIAGLGRIDTVVGAKLSAGEPIGVSESASPALVYFELRQNGKPINPQKLASAQPRNKEKI